MSKQPLKYFDSHCHFDFSDFDHDRKRLWSNCNHLGIDRLLIPSVTPKNFPKIADICQSYPGTLMAVGLHPWWIEEYKAQEDSHEILMATLLEKLNSSVVDKKCVAIGECGLDSQIDTSIEEQIPIFKAQLTLASDVNKPLIIHVRKSHNQIIEQLKLVRPSAGGVIHGFSGSYEMAKTYWELGFRLGVGGVITYPRAKKTIDAVSKMPLESIVLETDAPDMPLSGAQGKRNSPERVTSVAEALSVHRREPLELIAQVTYNNTLDVFQL